jgi:copper(I)-binding protein
VKPTILIATLLLAACGSGGAPEIAVSDAWAREARGGSTAAYLTITNSGAGADRLLAVSAPAPIAAALHETSHEGGISRMRPLDQGLEIPAGGSVELRPGGTHVMLTGLDSPLSPGDALPLVLRFERSGERTVRAEVRPAIGAANH